MFGYVGEAHKFALREHGTNKGVNELIPKKAQLEQTQLSMCGLGLT
jgi:hypothetical protein